MTNGWRIAAVVLGVLLGAQTYRLIGAQDKAGMWERDAAFERARWLKACATVRACERDRDDCEPTDGLCPYR